MADIFISYSRQDKAFVLALRDMLLSASRTVWVDLHDIPPTADWQEEINAAIDGADAFVFVLAPDSLASAACASEVAHALEARKRIIPILHRDVNPQLIPRVLAAIQWIPWKTPADSNTAFGLLLTALDTDLPYLKMGTRLFVRAREWESKARNSSFTLRGKELAEAEQWLAGSGGKEPPPSQLQTQYVAASRRRASARQRTLIGSLTTGILITLTLAILSTILYRVTLNQNQTLQAQALAGRANGALLQSRPDQALLLSLQAVRQDNDFDTRNALVDALSYSPYLDAVLHSDATSQPHDDPFDLAYSRDGRTLMSANHDHVITLWDTAAHTIRIQIHLPIQPPADRVSDVLEDAALSPDGQMVATKSALSGIMLWNPATGAQIASVPATGIDDQALLTSTLTFSPDGRLLAWSSCADRVCNRERVTLWDVGTRQVMRILPVGLASSLQVGMTLAFSPNSKLLAVGECDEVNTACPTNLLEVFAVAAGTRVGVTHIALTGQPRGTLQTITFSPDGRTIAVGGCTDLNCDAGEIAFWNVAAQQFSGTVLLSTGDMVKDMAYSPNGRYLVSVGGFGTVQVWDAVTGQLLAPALNGHSSLLSSVAFSPDGQHFATAGEDTKILLWNAAPYGSLSQLPGADIDGTSQVAFSPDGKLMAVGATGTITLWDTATGKRVKTLAIPGNQDVESLAFSPDGKMLATGDYNADVLLWNVATGKPDGGPLNGHQAVLTNYSLISDVAFSPDGRFLVSCGFDQQVVLTDVASRAIVHTFRVGQTIDPHGAAFSPDGHWLAIAGDTGVILWDMRAGQVARTLTTTQHEVKAVAFSRDGTLASLDVSGNITVWNGLTTPSETLFDGSITDTLFAPHLAFSPDGSLLVSEHDLGVTLWDVRSSTKYIHTIATSNEMFNAAFSPDGKYLAVAIDQGPVEVRPASLAGWEEAVCPIANRNLTQAEWRQFFPSDQPYQIICGSLPVPDGS